jgi:PGF-CTERM protein
MGLAELIFGICRTRSRLELYDVNFGGIERMTKRLTIALIALAMFVLVAVMPVSALFYNVAPNINQGAMVFIGEQGLNVTNALASANTQAGVTGATTIGWLASAAVITTTSPSNPVSLTGRITSLTIEPVSDKFASYPGTYYLVNATTGTAYSVGGQAVAVFTVVDPSLEVNIWDPVQGVSVNDKSVPQGTYLTIGVATNMYNVLNNPTLRSPVWNTAGNTYASASTGTSTSDGYIDIKVKDESGTTLTALYNVTQGAQSLVGRNVNTSDWKWGISPGSTIGGVGSNWSTDVMNPRTGGYAYPPGIYTVWAESLLNNMKDNYLNAGAAYSTKTVAQFHTVTLVSDTVKIEANKDSIVRSKTFSVTITGKPSTTYHVWVKGTSSMTGGYDDQPPMINANQAGVKFDTVDAAGIVDLSLANDGGSYIFQNSLSTIWANVAKGTCVGSPAVCNLGNGTYIYANVTTSTSGTRVVEFLTSNWTKAQKYTIRVEQRFPLYAVPNVAGSSVKSDEVDVKVEKGAVTIVAAGDQSYYLGEEVKFSGTNTESYKTYLFIIGPNLHADGAKLTSPREDAGFVEAAVQGDNTWSYKWGTSSLALDAGTYTIYAVSQAVDRSQLEHAAYGTVSIIIKKPFVSATASQSTVAKGDKIFITGTAEGQPASVQIWILGKNKDIKATTSVNADSSFKYEVTSTITKLLYAGQYFVVVQHPMQNGAFDIDTVGPAAGSLDVFVVNKMLGATTANPSGTTTIFKLEGSGSLQGSDAAEALVQGINDPNVDDTYTKLQFLVEEPIITIDPVGDRHVGDKFTITAQTNLAVDDEILVEVYSSSFKPTQKSQSGEFSGATGTVKVTKGDSGMNTISFPVDASTFKPDEYIVSEGAVIQEITGTALFNVLEGAAPTAVPTVVVTTVAPTTVATPVPTTVPPTPTPTKSPGYGALIALIGLGAVAFIVVRRH